MVGKICETLAFRGQMRQKTADRFEQTRSRARGGDDDEVGHSRGDIMRACWHIMMALVIAQLAGDHQRHHDMPASAHYVPARVSHFIVIVTARPTSCLFK